MPPTGLMKFSSVESIRHFLKDTMSYYEREADVYSEKVGSLMRILEADSFGKRPKKLTEVKWDKVGMLMVNEKEPTRGTLELLVEAMEEYKAKALRTAEILTTIDQLEALSLPSNASMVLYVRHGVPVRLVVDTARDPRVDELLNVVP